MSELLIVNVATLAPLSNGANLMLIEQDPPADRLVLHLLFIRKSPALAPVIATLLKINGTLPALNRVTTIGSVLGALPAVITSCSPKLIDDVLTTTTVPIPFIGTVVGVLTASLTMFS